LLHIQKVILFTIKSLKFNHSNFIPPVFGCSNQQQYETRIKRLPKIGARREIKGEIIFEEMMQEQILTALRSNKSRLQSPARQELDNLVCTAHKSASMANCILIYVLRRWTPNTLCSLWKPGTRSRHSTGPHSFPAGTRNSVAHVSYCCDRGWNEISSCSSRDAITPHPSKTTWPHLTWLYQRHVKVCKSSEGKMLHFYWVLWQLFRYGQLHSIVYYLKINLLLVFII